jgi:hypothetical protein
VERELSSLANSLIHEYTCSTRYPEAETRAVRLVHFPGVAAIKIFSLKNLKNQSAVFTHVIAISCQKLRITKWSKWSKTPKIVILTLLPD